MTKLTRIGYNPLIVRASKYMNDELNNEIISSFSKIFRAMKQSMSFRSKGSEITMLQFEALWCIKKSRHAHMADIAENFSITMPTATSLIDKLISLKLVKRGNDKRDRRIVRIGLTREGERLLREVMRQRESKINRLLSYLSKEDRKELLRILLIIANKAENYEKQTV